MTRTAHSTQAPPPLLPRLRPPLSPSPAAGRSAGLIRTPLSFRRRHRGCLVHDVRRLRLVVAHVGVGLVDAQRAARERRAVLSEEGGVGGGVGSEG